MGIVDENEQDGSGDDGQFLGEDLAKLVRLSPAVVARGGGQTLNDVDAESILVGRIRNVINRTAGEDYDRGRDIAEVIIDALPGNMRTSKVLETLDLRPYLKALDGKKIVRRLDGWPMDTTTTDVVDTKEGLVAFEEDLRTNMSAVQTDTPLTQAERDAAIKDALPYKDDEAGLLPGTSAEDIAILRGEAERRTGPPMYGQSANRFPEADFQTAIYADRLTLDGLIDAESGYIEDGGEGYFQVDVGLMAPRRDDLNSNRGAPVPQTISALDAKAYLARLPENEVKMLQIKLAEAGYYDRNVDAGSQYVEGDAFDPATREAWYALLSDSIREKTSTPKMLATRMREYRTETRMLRMKSLDENDTTYNAMLANDWAQQVIGRNLFGEELTLLESYLGNLRSQRAGFVAGSDNNTADHGLVDQYGVDANDIRGYINDNMGDEALVSNANRIGYKLSTRL